MVYVLLTGIIIVLTVLAVNTWAIDTKDTWVIIFIGFLVGFTVLAMTYLWFSLYHMSNSMEKVRTHQVLNVVDNKAVLGDYRQVNITRTTMGNVDKPVVVENSTNKEGYMPYSFGIWLDSTEYVLVTPKEDSK